MYNPLVVLMLDWLSSGWSFKDIRLTTTPNADIAHPASVHHNTLQISVNGCIDTLDSGTDV